MLHRFFPGVTSPVRSAHGPPLSPSRAFLLNWMIAAPNRLRRIASTSTSMKIPTALRRKPWKRSVRADSGLALS